MTAYKTKTCPVCHQQTELHLDPAKVQRWEQGEYLEDVWPDMLPEYRELLISGTHGLCWGELMGPDPDDDD